MWPVQRPATMTPNQSRSETAPAARAAVGPRSASSQPPMPFLVRRWKYSMLAPASTRQTSLEAKGRIAGVVGGPGDEHPGAGRDRQSDGGPGPGQQLAHESVRRVTARRPSRAGAGRPSTASRESCRLATTCSDSRNGNHQLMPMCCERGRPSSQVQSCSSIGRPTPLARRDSPSRRSSARRARRRSTAGWRSPRPACRSAASPVSSPRSRSRAASGGVPPTPG